MFKLRIAFGLIALFLLISIYLLPQLLWFIAAGAIMFLALERWRARPSWGRQRGLPPGSLGLFPDTWSDDRFYLKQAHQHGPIFKTSNFLRPTACVVGLEKGIQVLREQEERLETPYLPFSRFVPGGMLRYMHASQHRYYRSIFRRALASKNIRKVEPVLLKNIKRSLDNLSVESSSSDSGVNPLPYLDHMMLELWFLLFFAIERDSGEWNRLLRLYPVIDIANPAKASPGQIQAAVSSICEIVEDQRDIWPHPAPACLLGAIMTDNPEHAKDPVVIGNLIYMLSTTGADMSALLCWIIKKACDHPEWLERIANDGSVERKTALAERFVMETLRMRQSEFIYRAVVQDIDFDGFRIPRGWLLRVCVWESHRDPDIFSDPDCFNPDRFLNRSYSRTEYSPLGASTHACLAAYLVNFVASTFVLEMASRFVVTSPDRGLVELASSRHWAPGAAFRIKIRPQQ
jgi:cytochrome P450